MEQLILVVSVSQVRRLTLFREMRVSCKEVRIVHMNTGVPIFVFAKVGTFFSGFYSLVLPVFLYMQRSPARFSPLFYAPTAFLHIHVDFLQRVYASLGWLMCVLRLCTHVAFLREAVFVEVEAVGRTFGADRLSPTGHQFYHVCVGYAVTW